MIIKKPINIFFEILIYTSSMGFLIYASWNNLFNREVLRTIWDLWMWIGFFFMVSIITIRAMMRGKAKRATSAFYFGFVSGIFLWTFFVMVESNSGSILNSPRAFLAIIGTGIVAGGISCLYSYLFCLLLTSLKLFKDH